MTDTPPISYADARANAALWLFHVQKAGPDTFGMTREKYAASVEKFKRVVALLDAIVAHRASKEARG